MKKQTIAFVIVLIMLSGCGKNSGNVTKDIKDPDWMKKIMKPYMPLESSTDDARRFLYQEGFKCSNMKNFGAGDFKGGDYVFCERRDGGPVTYNRWMVALVHDKNHKIKDVQVEVKTIGPYSKPVEN